MNQSCRSDGAFETQMAPAIEIAGHRAMDKAQAYRSLEIAGSFEQLLGRPLLENRPVAPLTQGLTDWMGEVPAPVAAFAQLLDVAAFVVVAHGAEPDPILNFANAAALRLWDTDRETLLAMPSRKTAELMHRDERAEMLQRTQRDGYIDDYRGVRISATGKRFLIEHAIVWNVCGLDGKPAGQAATFSEWTELT